MEERDGIALISVIVLFGFMALAIPEMLNTAYAYPAGEYAALIIGLAVLVVCAFVYLIYKVLID